MTSSPAELAPDFALSAYDYELPSDRIAQDPVTPRDSSRLLVIERDRNLRHHHFYDLPDFLQAGDLLVFNNTKVIPARMYGQKLSGVPVEILLMEPVGHNRWLALVKPGKRLPVGSTIVFAERVKATVEGIETSTRARELQFHIPEDADLDKIIDQLGKVPLPPYVTDSHTDAERYQTIYAEVSGAIAAPTAGLHFTESLFQTLSDRGIDKSFVTLHVGIGTFRPVETEDITQHVMHNEWCEVPEETIAKIKETKAKGGRVIGVGSTVARSLENANYEAFRGKTNLMIYPGYEWKVLDGMITNFHLPKSTLLMMVASFLGESGREFLMSVYQEAIAKDYRFYSFGDAMLILR
ncbi:MULTISPECIES: tRNA preQ1(34) S-adenosylmethionine ribosyltransferase-isomerase QueA [Pseudanabaena]|uniref:S-adenosylmethionine:tRNA ribosyltransferase-isomerase n=2 Tax=Pseudanabaena TaxID=1152 RepID=L8N6N5_9CYAN|nr:MULTISPECIES: tRNA preQ1(34) S-adenosylmethionine ribosyltransferase-isomerase QueA [Pseudanabaena]ELS34370.1 S-adenosylmethionine--tRNA ribosyltransferase-isomerase [Pseudanabaena biceps PCC 7429]MDG3493422.1 tRNA preQ1(34) S-adenosylmethionine ribosyltransferase-isomerase QueA [Pseudanabaena catenata USMAC16]